jgi:hypothetical protein
LFRIAMYLKSPLTLADHNSVSGNITFVNAARWLN